LETKYGIRNLKSLFTDIENVPQKLRVSSFFWRYVSHQHGNSIFSSIEDENAHLFWKNVANSRPLFFVDWKSLSKHYSEDQLHTMRLEANARRLIAEKLGGLVKAKLMHRMYDSIMQAMFEDNSQFEAFFPENVAYRRSIYVEARLKQKSCVKIVRALHRKPRILGMDVGMDVSVSGGGQRAAEVDKDIEIVMDKADQSVGREVALKKTLQIGQGAGSSEAYGQESRPEEPDTRTTACMSTQTDELLVETPAKKRKLMKKSNMMEIGKGTVDKKSKGDSDSGFLEDGRVDMNSSVARSLLSRFARNRSGEAKPTVKFMEAQHTLIKSLVDTHIRKGPVCKLEANFNTRTYMPAWHYKTPHMRSEVRELVNKAKRLQKKKETRKNKSTDAPMDNSRSTMEENSSAARVDTDEYDSTLYDLDDMDSEGSTAS
jgi:hypothetical protein